MRETSRSVRLKVPDPDHVRLEALVERIRMSSIDDEDPLESREIVPLLVTLPPSVRSPVPVLRSVPPAPTVMPPPAVRL
jgi:hypothetical protein